MLARVIQLEVSLCNHEYSLMYISVFFLELRKITGKYKPSLMLIISYSFRIQFAVFVCLAYNNVCAIPTLSE